MPGRIQKHTLVYTAVVALALPAPSFAQDPADEPTMGAPSEAPPAEEPEPSALFSPGEERIERYQELWPTFLLIALGLFLLDLLLRRVRLFDRNFEEDGPGGR